MFGYQTIEGLNRVRNDVATANKINRIDNSLEIANELLKQIEKFKDQIQ